MNDVEWVPFMTALVMLGGGRVALRLLTGALMLGRVRSRGVSNYPSGPDEQPADIPADLWAEWTIRVEQGALIRPEYDGWQTPVGFIKLRFFRADIAALRIARPFPSRLRRTAPRASHPTATLDDRRSSKPFSTNCKSGSTTAKAARRLRERHANFSNGRTKTIRAIHLFLQRRKPSKTRSETCSED